jgi:peptide/nickel transport system ATP-binding protein
MHAGHVVEAAPTGALFRHARHPYTSQLIRATPTPEITLDQLASIPGNLPDLRRRDLPACRFLERCDRATSRCRDERPPAVPYGPEHHVWCFAPL